MSCGKRKKHLLVASPFMGQKFTLRGINSPCTSGLPAHEHFTGPHIVSCDDDDREDPGQRVKGSGCRPETQHLRVTPEPVPVPELGR